MTTITHHPPCPLKHHFHQTKLEPIQKVIYGDIEAACFLHLSNLCCHFEERLLCLWVNNVQIYLNYSSYCHWSHSTKVLYYYYDILKRRTYYTYIVHYQMQPLIYICKWQVLDKEAYIQYKYRISPPAHPHPCIHVLSRQYVACFCRKFAYF